MPTRLSQPQNHITLSSHTIKFLGETIADGRNIETVVVVVVAVDAFIVLKGQYAGSKICRQKINNETDGNKRSKCLANRLKTKDNICNHTNQYHQ